MNRITLCGNVGNAPEIKHTSANKKMAFFSVATTDRWTKDGTKHEKTQWHRVSVFNEALANVVSQFVKKGDRILVEGKMIYDKYEKDGQTHYSAEVHLENFNGYIELLGNKPESEAA